MMLPNSGLTKVSSLLGLALLARQSAKAGAQEVEVEPCVLRNGPSGLIRGDRIARELGSVQRHFGRLERHFGPIQREFGRVERNSSRR